MSTHVMAIDQGTTSSRVMIFDQRLSVVAMAQEEFAQHYPRSGWVEHDAEDIWRTVLGTARAAMDRAGLAAADIAAIGITNQRETTVIWERATGRPIHRAIVWQDRRTAKACERLKNAGLEALVREKTGLLPDPYFSATKIAWLLDNVEGARERAEAGELAFGTIDTFLLWRLTNGRVHATDATNASRTMLYDIHAGKWSEELLELFAIPAALLPKVCDSAADFGETGAEFLGAPVAIRGMAGDQQAASAGQACFAPGMMKSTYGTGCFAMLNTGHRAVTSRNRLLTTIALSLDGKVSYALEGSIFIAGAAVQWLRDGLGLIDHAAQSGELARSADPEQDVYLVPAFTGLGAPYWDAHCRGAIFGLTRGTGAAELARAALEAVCFQTHDLLAAMRADVEADGAIARMETVLRVDGGMVASDWTMQRLADILDAPVDRPAVLETTALGAAWLAGWRAGVCPGPEGFASSWALERRFVPSMAADERARRIAGWQDAVRRTLSPTC